MHLGVRRVEERAWIYACLRKFTCAYIASRDKSMFNPCSTFKEAGRGHRKGEQGACLAGVPPATILEVSLLLLGHVFAMLAVQEGPPVPGLAVMFVHFGLRLVVHHVN